MTAAETYIVTTRAADGTLHRNTVISTTPARAYEALASLAIENDAPLQGGAVALAIDPETALFTAGVI